MRARRVFFKRFTLIEACKYTFAVIIVMYRVINFISISVFVIHYSYPASKMEYFYFVIRYIKHMSIIYKSII